MRRARWIADNAVRWGSRWVRGEETDLEVGSNLRGRRVNVGSITATNGQGWKGVWTERDDGSFVQYPVFIFNQTCEELMSV